MAITAEIALDAGAALGEGPVWHPERGLLAWVDVHRAQVHLYDPSTGKDRAIDVGQPVGAALPRAGGGWVVAVRDGIAFMDEETGGLDMLAGVEAGNPANRMNDAKCDSRGRLWAGTMALDLTPGAGALYRIDPHGAVTTVLTDVSVSNGLDWTDDDSVMYFIDSLREGVEAFDFDADTGRLANRRTVVAVANDSSAPCGFTVADGMTLDAEGHLWVAMCGLGQVRRHAPDGRLVQVVEVPALGTTSVAFGGDDLGDLYITTSLDLAPASQKQLPGQGALYRCRPGATGRPPNTFAG